MPTINQNIVDAMFQIGAVDAQPAGCIPCGSISMINTRLPSCAKQAPKFYRGGGLPTLLLISLTITTHHPASL